MSRATLLKSLRIAWSVAWGMVAVLLIALLVRSYWTLDSFGFRGPTHSRAVVSENGVFTASIIAQPGRNTWENYVRPLEAPPDLIGHLSVGYYPDESQGIWSLVFPQWLLVLSIGVLGAAPWMLKRFTVLGTLAFFSRR